MQGAKFYLAEGMPRRSTERKNMKVTVEDVSSVKKILHFDIPEEKVVSELNDAYKTLKKTAKIKGFRPGKAPRSVLERMFKKDVHADVTSKLLQETFIDAIRENKLNIIGNPQIDPPELQATGGYKYDATVEIPPEIDDFDFKGISLEKTMYAASDGEVEAQLAMLRKNLAEKNPLRRIAPSRPMILPSSTTRGPKTASLSRRPLKPKTTPLKSVRPRSPRRSMMPWWG